MPLGIDIEPSAEATSDAWLDLIRRANSTIEICAMYMTMWEGDQYPSSGGREGRAVFDALMDALNRSIDVRIIETDPPFYPENPDFKFLGAAGARLGYLDWPSLANGSGVLHNKFMIIDHRDLYVGSANFDWRSLTQVKEFGVVIRNCTTTALDLLKVYEAYWSVRLPIKSLPPFWPSALDTRFNILNPMQLHLNSQVGSYYFAASPKSFNTPHRTNDIDALLDAANNAQKFIRVSVMDYAPVTIYRPQDPIFWPDLDDALRAASVRGVKVQLLFSFWNSTNMVTVPFMKSLNELANIEVRIMHLPDQQNGPVVPFTRVNHSKYLYTESTIYITTSNWTPDYFLFTGGTSLSIKGPICSTLDVGDVWDRDWTSDYTVPIDKYPFPPKNEHSF